jgi:hypothetical protein
MSPSPVDADITLEVEIAIASLAGGRHVERLRRPIAVGHEYDLPMPGPGISPVPWID